MIYKTIEQGYVVILPNTPRIVYNTLIEAITNNPGIKLFVSAWELN